MSGPGIPKIANNISGCLPFLANPKSEALQLRDRLVGVGGVVGRNIGRLEDQRPHWYLPAVQDGHPFRQRTGPSKRLLGAQDISAVAVLIGATVTTESSSSRKVQVFMSSKRRLKRNHCTGKAQYPTLATAQYVAALMRKKTGDLILAYKCRFGHHYHVGHPGGRRQPPK